MELMKRVLSYVKPYRKRLAAAIFSMILHSFLTILFIKVFKDLIDTMINNISNTGEGLVKLSWVAVGIIGVFFFKGVAYYGQKYLTSYVAQKAIRDIRNELYDHLQKLSLSFYDEMKTGQIMSRVTNDVGKLQSAIVSGAISLFYKSFTLIGGLGYLFYLSWKLALAVVLIFPAVTYVFIKFNKRIREVSRRVQAKIADITDVLQETITGVRIVKAFGQEDYEYEKFSQENHENFRATMKNTQLSASLTPIVEILASFAFTFVLWYGGYEVIKGNMTPGELLAFFTLLITISDPIKSLSKLTSTIQQALAAADRIFEIMDIDIEIKEKEDAIELEDAKGKVEFKDVYFSYNEEEVVLKGINLVANPGDIVALVGPSGAGKSTLVDLIPRFYEPQSGDILLDNYNIKDLTIASLRDKMGIVPQETILFGGNIKENIAYGSIDRSEEKVIAAAKAANAHEFITEFPAGYETEIGERGASLSGGQRQRIAIARAILKDPKILILDEATSALDTESEALVQEALERLMEERTTFVIAHRLSTVLNADKIVVLDEGEIVEIGTHDELLENGGLYSHLYEVQFTE
ncbi:MULTISPECIES: lipid A export permease/ATP-binding protein MsbA [unclassified Candidatus Frackibacter]|uniref:lipid A export permease/ATP-binding protein MsbA n=1 Tax=unclassified Candidatus Frackibacter TaxID=2648818 RepID=UPI000883A6A8|nr:ATP-binding cassette, subfamily B, MsbA [Candidatus Frackibacter sp. WG11]SEM37775.1 ATP-binding cassette, subfamily B, MsbA [Candidatus Frackibacter sp. WG12]SFL43222.1 ATP-binding cassette, subfamily B, MsbA [Candidatus Frackibacter sp. WG13]